METLNVLDLLEIMQALERKINLALNYAGLRLPLYRAMACLEKSGKITVSDLSRQLNVTRATTSVLVSQLKKANIIETIDNRADKRSFYVLLTMSGTLRLELARKEVAFVVRNISKRYPAEVIQALNDFTNIVWQEK